MSTVPKQAATINPDSLRRENVLAFLDDLHRYTKHESVMVGMSSSTGHSTLFWERGTSYA